MRKVKPTQADTTLFPTFMVDAGAIQFCHRGHTFSWCGEHNYRGCPVCRRKNEARMKEGDR